MASIISVKFPNAVQWPLVSLPQFERIASNLMEASSSVDMAFAPIVRRKDQSQFEDFAYDYFNTTTGTGQKNPNHFFGKGIWTYNYTIFTSNTTQLYNATNPTPGSIYHDVASETSRDDDLTFPLMNIVPTSVVMINLYSPWSSPTFQDVVHCSEQRALRDDWETVRCTCITAPARIFRHDNKRGALIIEPIYPANDPTTVSFLVSWGVGNILSQNSFIASHCYQSFLYLFFHPPTPFFGRLLESSFLRSFLMNCSRTCFPIK